MYKAWFGSCSCKSKLELLLQESDLVMSLNDVAQVVSVSVRCSCCGANDVRLGFSGPVRAGIRSEPAFSGPVPNPLVSVKYAVC
jgi:hypothetical protein